MRLELQTMNKPNTRKQDALDYHSNGRPGKIQVVPTKPTNSQRDLTLAYSPGVAEPCLQIADNVEDVYKYTAKGNLVGVISNGTAVLGLGNSALRTFSLQWANWNRVHSSKHRRMTYLREMADYGG